MFYTYELWSNKDNQMRAARQGLAASLLIVLALILLSSAAPAYASQITKPANNLGLVGYFAFNEGSGVTTEDSSFKNFSGSLTNGPTWTTGKFGNAINLNLTKKSFVQVTGEPTLGSNSITECAWVNVNAFDGDTFGDGVSAGNTIFTTRTSNGFKSPSLILSEKYNPGSVNAIFAYDTSANGLGDVGSTTIQLHTWYFICGTFQFSGAGIFQGTWDVYVNGVKDDPTSNNWVNVGSVSLPFTGTIWSIGQTPTAAWSPSNNMDGIIDEFRIYTRALSATEILNLYDLTAPSHANTSAANLTVGGSSLTNGLVGYWTFDGADMSPTVVDRSGNGNNGGFSGAPTSSAVTIGKLGQAINFNNDSAVVKTNTASEDTLNETGSMSASFWLYVTSEPHGAGAAGNDAFIVSKQSGVVGGGNVTFEIDALAGDPFGGGTDRLYLWWSSVTAPNVSDYASNVSYRIGQWDHWVVIRNNSNSSVTMYRNGVNVGTTDFNGDGFVLPVDSTGTAGVPAVMQIGNNSDAGGNVPLTGKIDDLRIYNRVLSASEVTALYNLGRAHINTSATTLTNGSTLTTGLAAHWTMDGKDTTWTSPSAGTTNDLSGNGRTGTFTSMTKAGSPTIGKLGQALNFSGTSYVRTASGFNMGSTSVTECAWVNVSGIVDGASIFGTDAGSYIFTTLNGGGSSPDLLLTDEGTPNQRLFFVHNDPAHDTLGTFGATPITTGKWWFLCGVFSYDANIPSFFGNWDVYVNGKKDNASSNNLSGLFGSQIRLPFTGTTWTVGADLDVPDHMDGKIDDMRVYTRALSAAEIMQLYLIGK